MLGHRRWMTVGNQFKADEFALVCDVEYREFTGGSLRHPSFRGLRNDKLPDEVDLPGRH